MIFRIKQRLVVFFNYLAETKHSKNLHNKLPGKMTIEIGEYITYKRESERMVRQKIRVCSQNFISCIHRIVLDEPVHHQWDNWKQTCRNIIKERWIPGGLTQSKKAKQYQILTECDTKQPKKSRKMSHTTHKFAKFSWKWSKTHHYLLSFQERWLPRAFWSSLRLNTCVQSQCSGFPRFTQNTLILCRSSGLSSILFCRKKEKKSVNFISSLHAYFR